MGICLPAMLVGSLEACGCPSGKNELWVKSHRALHIFRNCKPACCLKNCLFLRLLWQVGGGSQLMLISPGKNGTVFRKSPMRTQHTNSMALISFLLTSSTCTRQRGKQRCQCCSDHGYNAALPSEEIVLKQPHSDQRYLEDRLKRQKTLAEGRGWQLGMAA